MGLSRDELRAIAKSKSLQVLLQAFADMDKKTSLLRIGDRDIHTGKSEVIHPNGGIEIAGIKIFSSTPAKGTPVRSTRIGNNYALDQRSNIPLKKKKKKVEITEKLTLKDTFIIFILDVSGSMNDAIPVIKEMIEQITENLASELYEDDLEKVKTYVKTYEYGSEDWLGWFSLDARTLDEEGLKISDENVNSETLSLPDRHVVISFINESDPVYTDPSKEDRSLYYIPNNNYANDYNNFISSFNSEIRQREFFKGLVICTQDTANSNYVQAFANSLVSSIEGTGLFSNYSELKEKGIEYSVNVPASTPASEYLDKIKTFLSLKSGE